MDNTEKLLRAFIEVSGYEIETIESEKTLYDVRDLDCNQDPFEGVVGHTLKYVDYKVTKKAAPTGFDCWATIGEYTASMPDGDIAVKKQEGGDR